MLCNRKEKGQNLFHLCLKLTFLERRRETSKQNIRIHLCTIPVHKRDIVKVMMITQKSNILKQKERGTLTRGTITRGTTTRGTTTRGIEHQASDVLQILPVPGQWCGLSARCVCGWLGIFMHARLPLFTLIFPCTVLLGLQIVIVHVLFQLMLFAQCTE